MYKKSLSYVHLIWMALFVLAPILMVLVYSLTTKDANGNSVLTFAHYAKFVNPAYIGILWKSVWIAALASAVCLLLGFPAAMILCNRDRRRAQLGKKGSVLLLFVMPMWMNMLLRTYSWLTILEKNGLLNNLLEALHLPPVQLLYTTGAVVLGMVYNFIPFMILPIYSVLVKIDRSVIEAAEDLGANSFCVYTRIIIPLSLPGVISGITMVFLPAITTFIISQLLGGGQYMLFGNLIEQQFLKADNWNFGSALSIVMMILIFLAMRIMNLFNKNGQQVAMF
ncbi:MAG: ABC transporter permease [Ruminococcaceae bacterium]|nr:ABC transporter permease [Oscillospiraceae bacterium]